MLEHIARRIIAESDAAFPKHLAISPCNLGSHNECMFVATLNCMFVFRVYLYTFEVRAISPGV